MPPVTGSASLLPPGSNDIERGIEASIARAAALPVPLRDLWNPATCPLALLPWLAWALSVDTWSPDWPEPVKRARITHAIEVQRHKGTLAAIRTIVGVFGGAISIREWWQTTPPGTPHTFDIVLSVGSTGGVAASAELVDNVITEITRAKPVRSHFNFLSSIDAALTEGLIAVARPAVFARMSASVEAAL